MATLKRDLGKEKIGHLDRHKLIGYGRKRADQGAGPVTLGIDIGVIKMILIMRRPLMVWRSHPKASILPAWR